MYAHLRILLLACLVTVAAPTVAETVSDAMNSGWLDLIKGSRDDTTGAELMDIEQGETEGRQKVTIAIPKSSMGNPDTIEEVVVVGRAPEKGGSLQLPNIEYEWVKDYDEDNHGLIIHLGDGAVWPIRLQMKAPPGLSE